MSKWEKHRGVGMQVNRKQKPSDSRKSKKKDKINKKKEDYETRKGETLLKLRGWY